MTSQTACPKCGQYKLHSSKIPGLSVGIFLAFCGAWLSLLTTIWNIFDIPRIVFFTLAGMSILAGSLQKGQTCQNCHHRLLPAQ